MNTETAGNDPRSVLEEGEHLVARVWRLLALRVWSRSSSRSSCWCGPTSFSAMVTVVGAFAIASGFVSGVAAYALPGGAAQHRVWLGLNSLIGLGVGVAMLVWPDLSATALLYAIAIWAIAEGVTELVTAFALPTSGTRTVLMAISGSCWRGSAS